MSDNYQMQLKPTSIINVPLQSYPNDFTFIVNGELIKTNRIISDLLSPKISQIHYVDSTCDSFTINTTNKGDFSQILNLVNFEMHEIPSSELPFITEVLKFLGNDLIDILYTGESEEMTISNILNLLRIDSNPSIFLIQLRGKLNSLVKI